MSGERRYFRYDFPAVDERGPMACVVWTYGEDPDLEARMQCRDMGYPPPDVMPEPIELHPAVVDGVDINEALMERYAEEDQ